MDHEILRVVSIGDSIADGLGAADQAFPEIVARCLDLPLLRHTGTAQMIDASRGRVACRDGDLALIMHGITEAIPRPNDEALALLPRRWRGPGAAEPRPYFSSRLTKRVAQRIDSACRWRAKTIAMRHAGTVRWMAPEAYEEHLRLLLMRCRQATRVVVIGGSTIDDRFFPGARALLIEYAAISQRLANLAGAIYVDIAGLLSEWNDFQADRFHPNIGGHKRIAYAVLSALELICVVTGQVPPSKSDRYP